MPEKQRNSKSWQEGLESFRKIIEQLALTPRPEDNREHSPAVITLYSASGGVGTSTTAKNLSLYLSLTAQTITEALRISGQGEVRDLRILLLDGDLTSGSLALRSEGIGGPSLTEMIDKMDKNPFWPASITSLREVLLPSSAAPGLDVLAAPERPEMFIGRSDADYERIISCCKKYYDIIVIDSDGDFFRESTRVFLENSDRVLMLTTADVNSLYQNSKHMRMMCRRAVHPRYVEKQEEADKALVGIENCLLLLMPFDRFYENPKESYLRAREMFSFLGKEDVVIITQAEEETFVGNNDGQQLSPLQNTGYLSSIRRIVGAIFQ